MTEMDPEARALLDRARVELSPTDDDRARVRRAVALGLLGAGAVAGATVASTTTAASAGGLSSSATAASLSGLSIGVKVSLVVAAVAVAAGGTVYATKHVAAPPAHVVSASPEPNEHGAPRAHVGRTLHRSPATAPSVAVPEVVPVVAPDLVPTPAAPSEHAAPVAATAVRDDVDRSRHTHAVVSHLVAAPAELPEPTPEDLTAETALLTRARAALAAGEGPAALALLDDLRTRFPHGQHAEDEASTRVSALCACGRQDDAVQAFAAFHRNYPGSVFNDRLSRSCAAR